MLVRGHGGARRWERSSVVVPKPGLSQEGSR